MLIGKVFLPYDGTHGFLVHFAFHPTDDVEVSKSPGLEPVLLEFLDFLQKILQGRPDLRGRNIEIIAQEGEHLLLHHSKILHSGHIAEY